MALSKLLFHRVVTSVISLFDGSFRSFSLDLNSTVKNVAICLTRPSKCLPRGTFKPACVANWIMWANHLRCEARFASCTVTSMFSALSVTTAMLWVILSSSHSDSRFQHFRYVDPSMQFEKKASLENETLHFLIAGDHVCCNCSIIQGSPGGPAICRDWNALCPLESLHDVLFRFSVHSG